MKGPTRLKFGYRMTYTSVVSLFLTMGLFACSSSKTALDDGLSESDSLHQISGDDLTEQGYLSGSESSLDLVEASEQDAPSATAEDSELQAAETVADEETFELETDADAAPAESAVVAPVQEEQQEVAATQDAVTEDAAPQESEMVFLKDTPKYGRSVSRALKPITVEGKPFVRDDFAMNAFYFVRSNNESWVSLSKKLYGRPDRSGLIKSWNSHVASLKVGQVIYYNSPGRPEDNGEMKPFAMDFGGQLDQVEIKPGDSLSLIAKNLYGDANSWKEISALNPQISNPNVIEPGQTIYIQPAEVDTAGYLAGLISKVEQVAKSENIDSTQAPSNVADSASMPPAPEESVESEVPAQQVAANTQEPKNEPKKANAPPAADPKTDQSILYMRVGIVLIAGAIIAFLLLRIKRRKEAARLAAEHTVHDFPSSQTGT